MSETFMTIEDAARTLPAVVERVHASGEAAVLTRSGFAVVQPREMGELVAFRRQWRIVHPEPDEQFGEAIEESRRAVQPI